MTANLLILNPSKTESILISQPQQLSKIHSPSLSLPLAQSILPCSSARNLGFVFDSSFSFSQQISKLSSSCHYHIRDLRRIRNSLDHKTAATITTSLVHFSLDYYNSLYYSLPASQLHRLQLIQNALARAVSRTPLHYPISPVLHSLHWLKIEQRIQYKIISITRNLLHMLHLSTSIVSSIFNPLVLHASQTVSVWLTLNSLLDSISPTDVFVMLHLLFETNYPLPFVPSPQKQLMPIQYHSHHSLYLISNSLTLRTSEASIPALRKLPCGVGRRYTDFARTSLWHRKPVYRRHGMSTPGVGRRYTGFVF